MMSEWKSMGWQIVGWSLAALAVLTAAALIAVWVQKKFPGDGCDERQKQIRGDAYRFAFWVGLVIDLALYAGARFGNGLPLEMETVLFVGILIQIVVFHLYCLAKKMELPLASRGWLTVICYAVIAAANVRSFYGNLEYAEAYQYYVQVEPDTTLVPGIIGEDTYLMMVTAVAFAALAVIHLIRLWQQEQED